MLLAKMFYCFYFGKGKSKRKENFVLLHTFYLVFPPGFQVIKFKYVHIYHVSMDQEWY